MYINQMNKCKSQNYSFFRSRDLLYIYVVNFIVFLNQAKGFFFFFLNEENTSGFPCEISWNVLHNYIYTSGGLVFGTSAFLPDTVPPKMVVRYNPSP